MICPSSPNSPFLALCKGSVCSSSQESYEYVSATYFQSLGTTSHFTTGFSLPLLPPTIRSLCLAWLVDLTSADLSSISECCPNLRCLNIRSCSNALLSLSGLADIGQKCLQLTSLNINLIFTVECLDTLWDVLASIKNLRHLAISDHLLPPPSPFYKENRSHIHRSAIKMNLFAFEIYNGSDVLQLDILLPAFLWLKHLHISGHIPQLDNILPAVFNLTHLALLNEYDGDLPTDPICYPSLKQIYISQMDLSGEFFRALAHSRSLTHMYIQCANLLLIHGPIAQRTRSQPSKQLDNLQFEDFPRLCELCVYVSGMPSDLKQVDDDANGFFPFNLEDHGVCGFVKKYQKSCEALEMNSDLRSLWV